VWRKLLGVLVGVLCVVCLGAQAQELTKGDREPTKAEGALFLGTPSWEVWHAVEVQHWTSTDGYRYNETIRYTLVVWLDESGLATEFEAYTEPPQGQMRPTVLLWDELPPVPCVWNDHSVRNPAATFSGVGLVGVLRINSKWVLATGKITQCIPDSSYPNVSWYCEGNLTATYDHTQY
jgi:hypothetical protein